MRFAILWQVSRVLRQLCDERRNPRSAGRNFLTSSKKRAADLNRLLTRFLEFAKPRQPGSKMVEIDEVLESFIALISHAEGTNHIELPKRLQPGHECDSGHASGRNYAIGCH